jgi:uncharacterized membrane protein YeaQ/YmgE (transglycosylase-associated protein family)
MNAFYEIIVWMVVGVLAGWLGSKLMATEARVEGLENVVVAIIGGLVGGLVFMNLFGDSAARPAFVASASSAWLGSCLVLLSWRRLATRSA